MSSPLSRLARKLAISGQTLAQFGLGPSALYGLYQFGLISGHYKRVTPAICIPPLDRAGDPLDAPPIQDILTLPAAADLVQTMGDQVDRTLREADEIVSGSFRPFGGPPAPLELEPPPSLLPLQHWTAYERGKQHWISGKDIKFLWEPGRFGWAFPLARAFAIRGEERFAEAFWEYTGRFIAANPPYLGPQWSSGQEVALRLIALAFAAQVFRLAQASSPRRMAWLAKVLSAHARRIPTTLVYARSQQNNHLISEAAGLITAAVALPGAPEADHWRAQGETWFNRAVLAQIRTDGAYIQHSTNYHRLMLTEAVWVSALLAQQGKSLPEDVLARLGLATEWLASRLDAQSGQTPNLGHNDGSLILPLSSTGYSDFRPVVQAASQAFLQRKSIVPGCWDEMALWLTPPVQASNTEIRKIDPGLAPTILRSSHSWAELRAVTFRERPAHADQLHVELWWNGMNIAQDAGTYLYNAPAPWENALGATRVHNTVEIDSRDQMTRAGRFRWLDWAQAQILTENSDSSGETGVVAQHDGYAQIGAIHRRSLQAVGADQWMVSDQILPAKQRGDREYPVRLHWLLPDWHWEWKDQSFQLFHSGSRVILDLRVASDQYPHELPYQTTLSRCGEIIFGHGDPDPILGWFSPTYGQRIPALSLSVHTKAFLPIRLFSTFTLLAS